MNTRLFPTLLRHLVQVDANGADVRYLGNAGDGRLAERAKTRLAAEHGLPLNRIDIRLTAPKGV